MSCGFFSICKRSEKKGQVTWAISAILLRVPARSAAVSCPAAAPGTPWQLPTQSGAQPARVMPCLSPPASAACSSQAARAAKDVRPNPPGAPDSVWQLPV